MSMFKKFGENPVAYAVVSAAISAVIASTIIFYIEGKDKDFLAIAIGVAIGFLVYYIGQSHYNEERYMEQLQENNKLRDEINKPRLQNSIIEDPNELLQSLEDNSFEGFRNTLSLFEKNVLSHFKQYTGHELSDDLYYANPSKHPEHWLARVFNKVIDEYKLKHSELSEAQKTFMAGDFLIYKVCRHHPDKSGFYTQAVKGLSYLEGKYSGNERKRISKLLTIYNSVYKTSM